MSEYDEDEATELELISPEALFEPALIEEDYQVRPGFKMRIRALSRLEMMRAQKLDEDRPKQEQYLLSVAVLRPVLTPGDVARWQRAASVGEIERVARRVNALSGIGKDAAKSDLSDDGESAGA
jgi:hypothetical protein